MRESGFHGVPAYLWIGLLAPAQTPTAVIEKLNTPMNEGMKAPEMQASIAKLGAGGGKKTSKVLKDSIMASILMATSTLRMKASLLNAVSQGSNQG
jgi:tripartite-type tricarboxylate transporter receptor subunit TctC